MLMLKYLSIVLVVTGLPKYKMNVYRMSSINKYLSQTFVQVYLVLPHSEWSSLDSFHVYNLQRIMHLKAFIGSFSDSFKSFY